MKYRPDIDGLRAIAVLTVVFYHAGVPGPSGGFLGVDVFFVISGFLITNIIADEILRGEFSLVSFYERRARRILPALSVVVLTTLIVGWFLMLPAEFKNLGMSSLATALFVSNIYFTLTLNYFTTAADFAPLVHTWSLAVEEQFYLFFPPLLAFLLIKYGTRTAVRTVIILSIASLVAAIVMLPTFPRPTFFLIVTRAWELGVGALLAIMAIRPPSNSSLRELLATSSLLAILIPVFAYDSSTPFPGLAAVPAVLGSAGLILAGGIGYGSTVNRILAHRLLVWIGLISYSLYLWHWPILAYLRLLLGTVNLPIAVGLVAAATSVLCAWGSYLFVERPFRRRPPQGFSAKSIFLFSGSSILALVALGGLLYTFDGIPDRLSASIQAVAATKGDRNPRHAECLTRLPKDGLCALGSAARDGDPVDFLFWGDSHADAMMPAIDLAAQASNKRGVYAGTSACPPVIDIRKEPEIRACTTLKTSVWAYLQERSDVPLVILAARWTLPTEGTRYRDEPGSPFRLVWTGDHTARPLKNDSATLLEAGLQATVQAILATGRSVVIIGPTPEVGWDVPNVLARNQMLGLPLPEGVSKEEYNKRSGRTEALLARIADSSRQVRYIPLSDSICSLENCAIRDNTGLPLYIDDNHISRSAAESLLVRPLSTIWSPHGIP